MEPSEDYFLGSGNNLAELIQKKKQLELELE